MGLTKKEAVELHRKLWRRIAKLEEPDQDKKYDIAKEIAKREGLDCPANGCFCCEYAEQESYREKVSQVCSYCPIDWGGRGKCGRKDGLYEKWSCTTSKEEFSRLALKIANLPER